MLTAGIWAPSTAARAELPSYSQAGAIPVGANSEDRHSALLRVSSPNLTARPSHKISLADVFWHQLLLIFRVETWLLKSQPFWKHGPLLTWLFESFPGVTKYSYNLRFSPCLGVICNSSDTARILHLFPAIRNLPLPHLGQSLEAHSVPVESKYLRTQLPFTKLSKTNHNASQIT